MNIFIKFLGVGGISTAFQYVLLYLFVEHARISSVNAAVIAYLLSSVFNYIANYYVTFESPNSHRTAAIKFAFCVSIGLMLTGLLMFLISEKLKVHYFIAQILTTIFVILWNFISQKIWVFKQSGISSVK